ncbi:MAG: HlyD family secretion protein [Nevskiales bacterium]
MNPGSSDTALFRPEAIQEKHAKLQGRIIIRSPRLLFYASAISATALVSAGLLLGFGGYAPRQTVPGFLEPERGVVKVFAARPGKVDMIRVKEGQRVKFRQTLALISAEQALIDSEGKSVLERILRELTEAQGRLGDSVTREEETSASNKSRTTDRIASLRQELRSAEAEKAVLEQLIASVKAVLARYQKLHQSGSVTEVELAAHQQRLLELERQGHALAKSLATAASALKDAELELKQQPAQARQRKVELENRISEIKRQIVSYEIERGYAVTAPIAGIVTALQIEPGKPVNPAQPLLAIVAEDAPLLAQLLVPSRSIGFVGVGQQVRLRYAAFPYQQYGVYQARVQDISRTTLRPEDLAVGITLTEPVYRVTAVLNRQTIQARGRKQSLQAGMLLDADIILEERPLWAWLLQPVLAFRGRL